VNNLFSLLADGRFDRTRNALRTFRIVDSFEELYHTRCNDVAPQPENLIYPISGEIGMYEVIKNFIKLQQINNTKAGEVFTFSDTLTFTTFLKAGVQPTLMVGSLSDRFRLTSANGDFSASRNDIHEVVVSMAGDKPRAAGAKASGESAISAAKRLGAFQSNSSLVATTLIQSASNPRDRALLELDRQRIIQLQNRSQNLLVGP
jgi:hypothetical protein